MARPLLRGASLLGHSFIVSIGDLVPRCLLASFLAYFSVFRCRYVSHLVSHPRATRPENGLLIRSRFYSKPARRHGTHASLRACSVTPRYSAYSLPTQLVDMARTHHCARARSLHGIPPTLSPLSSATWHTRITARVLGHSRIPPTLSPLSSSTWHARITAHCAPSRSHCLP